MGGPLESIRDFVHDQIHQVAKENRQPLREIDDNFNLVESGLFDSVQFVELLLAIEQEFQVTIDPADLASADLVVLGNLLRAIERSARRPPDREESSS